MPVHRHLEGRVTSLAIQAAFCARTLTMLNLYLLVTLIEPKNFKCSYRYIVAL